MRDNCYEVVSAYPCERYESAKYPGGHCDYCVVSLLSYRPILRHVNLRLLDGSERILRVLVPSRLVCYDTFLTLCVVPYSFGFRDFDNIWDRERLFSSVRLCMYALGDYGLRPEVAELVSR